MLITKLISIGVNIQNCIGLFTDANNLKSIIKEKFEGKCFRCCLVKSVDRIVRVSDCVINQEGSPNYGVINAIVEITGIVYGPGEIINGCTVTNKGDHGVIICSTEHASIIIQSHRTLESIQPGQKISIRVGQTRYGIGASKIAVNAVPFIPTATHAVYKMPAEAVNKALLIDVIERIKDEESQAEALRITNPNGWDTFNQLLYAYTEKQPTPKGVKAVSVFDIVDSKPDGEIYISRDPRLDLATPMVYQYANNDAIPVGQFVAPMLTANQLAILMLEDYCAHLRTIREMLEIYSTPEMVDLHKNIWLIFRKAKLQK